MGKFRNWRIFMDCVLKNPSNERVKNYIEFIHQKKIDLINKKLPQKSIAGKKVD